jgi:hypothetical protein
MSKITYDKKISGKFYVERRPKEIAELLVKICEENDDRVGQAMQNALAIKFGDNNAHDIFNMEDPELLKILQAYYKSSKK